MINPVLYVFRDEELQVLITTNSENGLPLFDCVLEEGINQVSSLTFTVPSDHPMSRKIQAGDIVILKDLDGLYRPYMISDDDDVHDVEFKRTFYAEDLAIVELNDVVIEDIRPQNTTAENALFRLLTESGSRWEPGTVSNLGINSTNFYYETVMNGIKKILETWGGEIRFRVTMDPVNNKITGRYVDLVSRLGTDTGKRFEYSKDMLDVERNINTKQLKTALYGRGKGVETESGGYGRRLTFADVEWKTSNGDPADKPLGQEWIGDEDARLKFGHLEPNGVTKSHRMGVFISEDQTDPEELLKETWNYLQQINKPLVTYRMNVIDLEQVSRNEYKHESVRIGDTVGVIDRHFGAQIETEARVVEIKRDFLRPENTRITIGHVEEDITRLIGRIQDQIKDKVGVGDPISWLEGVIDGERTEFEARTAYVYINNSDGILVTNKPKDSIDDPATEAIQIKGGALAIANSRTPQGDWNWRTFITGEHVIADQITAGSMLADRIRGGVFIVGGSVNGIGKSGQLLLMNEEDEIVCQLDAETRGFDNLFVGRISGNNVVTRTTRNITYYVDPINGSDNNDGLGQPVKSFDRLLGLLPNQIDHFVTVNVIGDPPPTWDEEIYISSFNGGGYLVINFNGSTLNGHIKIKSCSVTIRLIGGTINHTGSISWQDSNPWACIHVVASMDVLAQDMTLNANNKAFSAIRFTNSFGYVDECECFNGNEYLIWGHDIAQLNATNNKGRGGPIGMFAANGAVIAGYGTQPQGDTSPTGVYAGGEIRGTWTIDPGTPPSAPDQPGITTWEATQFKSWDTVFGWNSDYPTQGNPGNWGPSGTHRGLYFFNYNSIQSTLIGKTIKKVRLKIQRNTNSGYYDSRPVYFWLHNNSGPTGGQPSLYDSAGNLANFKPGETKWVDLPISYGNALRDGTAKGIGIYVSPGDQQNYVRMARVGQLEITY